MDTDTENTCTYEFEGSYSDEGAWSSDNDDNDMLDQMQSISLHSHTVNSQSDKKWVKTYVNSKFKESIKWNNEDVPIVGTIYHIFSLDAQQHLFMYFTDNKSFKRFVYRNWFWTSEASIIAIRRYKKLSQKIYISYKLNNNNEVDELYVYTNYKRAKKHFNTNKKCIWKELSVTNDTVIPDLVRIEYTRGKSVSELRNEWQTH